MVNDSSFSYLPPVKPSGRSRLHQALKIVAQWSEDEREFFVRAFTTRTPESQLANELGISLTDYQSKRRILLRRFRQAASQ